MLKNIKQAVLYDIILPFMSREETVGRLKETEHLLETYGGIVLVKIIQRRHHAGNTSFIGCSKFEEIIETSKEIKANLLIINASLKPSQIYHLRTHLENIRLKLEVWDRHDFKYLPYVMVSAKKLLYLENLILLIEKTLYK